MSSTLDKNLVYESDEKALISLSMDGTNTKEWKEIVKAANFYFDLILSFPSEAFWSTVAYSKAPLSLLDSFLNVFPRNYELAQKKLYFSTDLEVKELFLQLYQRILLFVLRLFTSLKLEGDEVVFDTNTIASILYTYRIFTGERLAKICAIYGRDQSNVLTVVFNRLFNVQPKLLLLLNLFFEKTHQDVVSRIQIENLDGLEKSEKNCDTVIQYLDEGIDLFFSLFSLIQLVKVKNSTIKNFFSAVAQFVNAVARTLPDKVIMELTSTRPAYIKMLLLKRSMLLQNAMNFFVELYKNDVFTDVERYNIIYEILNYKECLIRFHFQYNLLEELRRLELKKVCVEEHTKLCRKALSKAIKEQSEEIKSRLAAQGLLLNVGAPANSEIAHAIDSLQDLFPNFSGKLLHLCLRHFGYDIDAVTNDMLEPALMPLHLKILLSAKENFSDLQPSDVKFPLVADDFEEEDWEEKSKISPALQEPSKKSTFSLDLEPSKITNQTPKTASAEIEEIQRRTTVASKLEKFIEKSSGLVDTTEAKIVQETIQKAHSSSGKSQKILFGDTIMIKHDKERKLQISFTEEKKAAIRAATLDKHYQIEFEDELEEKAIEEQQKRGFQVTAAQQMEKRLAAEVGVSGRFNRPTRLNYLNDNCYEDEYDDTYDDNQLYAMDIGAIKIEDDDTSVVLEEKAKKNKEQKKEKTVEEKKFLKKEDMKNDQRRYEESKNTKKDTRNENKYLNGPPGFENQPSSHSKKSNNPIFIERPKQFKSKTTERIEKNSNRDQVDLNPPTEFEDRPQQSSQQRVFYSRSGGNKPESIGRQTSYTGGRERQFKERHKNKDRQRGADKKMRGGML